MNSLKDLLLKYIKFPLSKEFTVILASCIAAIGTVAVFFLVEVNIFLALVVAHFIADFILQSDEMALNKSKDNKMLIFHVSVYSLYMLLLFGFQFALVNWFLHLGTDYVTSRLNTKLYKEGEMYWFFKNIGFDQVIHLACLFLTYEHITTFSV